MSVVEDVATGIIGGGAIGGSTGGFIGGITGGGEGIGLGTGGINELSGENAIRDAARAQQGFGERAITAQEEALAQLRADLAPFTQAGTDVLPQLQGSIFGGFEGVNVPNSQLPGQQFGLNPFQGDSVSNEAIINDPFFQALAGDQEQRLLASANARGKVGAGGTSDDLIRNQLLLGNQFKQQAIENQRTGQAQQFGQSLLGNQFGLSQAGQQFNQDLASQQFNQANQLLANQQTFNQLLGIAGLGQASAAQQGAASQAAGSNIGNFLTQIGNVQAGAGIAGQNAQNQFIGDILGGVTGALGSGGMFGSGGALAGLFPSDRRLKQNIKPAGEHQGHKFYTWEWNDKAKELGLEGSDFGVIAQEVEQYAPELITENQGYKQVNYGKLLWH